MCEFEISITGLGIVSAIWNLNADSFRELMADCLRYNKYVRVEVKGYGIMYINPAHIRYFKLK